MKQIYHGGPDPAVIRRRLAGGSPDEFSPPELIFLAGHSSPDPARINTEMGVVWAYETAVLAQAHLPRAPILITITLEDQADYDAPVQHRSQSLKRLVSQIAGTIIMPPELQSDPLLRPLQGRFTDPTYRDVLAYLNQLGYPAEPGSTLQLLATALREGSSETGFILPADYTDSGYLIGACLDGAKIADLRDAPRMTAANRFLRAEGLNVQRLEENGIEIVLMRSDPRGTLLCILPRAVPRLSWVATDAIHRDVASAKTTATPELRTLIELCAAEPDPDPGDEGPAP